MERSAGEITALLKRVRGGDAGASDRLAEAVFADLRRIAKRLMGRERAGHTLQPTAIAGEAYLNLIEHSARNWENRAHFFAVATQAMRRILVDYARRKGAEKRGGYWQRVVQDAPQPVSTPFDDVVAVHEALERLSGVDPRQARIVELRYFGGLT